MNPDIYIPLYWRDFESATAGWPDAIRFKYLRCIAHYVLHTHCAGLPDDEELLQGICWAKDDEWPRVRELIFAGEPFFGKIAGKWHQKRALEEYQKSLKLMSVYKHRASRAANIRWKG